MVCAASMRAMTFSPSVLCRARGLRAAADGHVLQRPLDLDIEPGLLAIIGDEGVGKTLLLHWLAGLASPAAGSVSAVDACCLPLSLPEDDAHTPHEVWQRLRHQFARWSDDMLEDLIDALDLRPHAHKALFKLSTGSRRKVGIAASLASGATLVCLDQPWMGLDMASIRVLREFLHDMAEHPNRVWIVADYEADPTLPWRQIVALS